MAYWAQQLTHTRSGEAQEGFPTQAAVDIRFEFWDFIHLLTENDNMHDIPYAGDEKVPFMYPSRNRTGGLRGEGNNALGAI